MGNERPIGVISCVHLRSLSATTCHPWTSSQRRRSERIPKQYRLLTLQSGELRTLLYEASERTKGPAEDDRSTCSPADAAAADAAAQALRTC